MDKNQKILKVNVKKYINAVEERITTADTI